VQGDDRGWQIWRDAPLVERGLLRLHFVRRDGRSVNKSASPMAQMQQRPPRHHRSSHREKFKGVYGRASGRDTSHGAHGQDRTADLPLTKGVLYH
jgi:hypothetical protein